MPQIKIFDSVSLLNLEGQVNIWCENNKAIITQTSLQIDYEPRELIYIMTVIYEIQD